MATIRAWLGGVITSLAAMVVVVVVASSLLVAQPNNSGLNEPYKYAEVHTSLHGKIVAFSHHDVLKITEPPQLGDSGSPVYRIRVGPGGYKDVAAYGVLAGKFF